MTTLNIQQSQKNVLLEASKVSKVFGSGGEKFHAANQVDLEIYEGDFTIIMGSSGSGKSTLLYLLSGLDSVSDGEIHFRNKRIDQYGEADLSTLRTHQIGFVYQAIHLVPDLTLFENVAFPGYLTGRDKREIHERANTLMASMDIDKQMNRLPSQVSGGQQQRAAIARALINSPEVIFADEPTGALNREQGNRILDILTEVNRQGQSIVMVTHDLTAASRADRLILINDGRVEGCLALPKYDESDLEEREKQIFAFMSGKEG